MKMKINIYGSFKNDSDDDGTFKNDDEPTNDAKHAMIAIQSVYVILKMVCMFLCINFQFETEIIILFWFFI